MWSDLVTLGWHLRRRRLMRVLPWVLIVGAVLFIPVNVWKLDADGSAGGSNAHAIAVVNIVIQVFFLVMGAGILLLSRAGRGVDTPPTVAPATSDQVRRIRRVCQLIGVAVSVIGVLVASLAAVWWHQAPVVVVGIGLTVGGLVAGLVVSRRLTTLAAAQRR